MSKLSKKDKKRIRHLFDIFQKKLPTKSKTILKFKKMKRNYGYFFRRKKINNIFLDKTSNFNHQIQTLIHEYAHALQFEEKYNDSTHSDRWGIYYARVYRCFLKNIDDF